MPFILASRLPARPKLDPFVGIIDQILGEDGKRPGKQRHTSKRIFERLRDGHGYVGGLTIVKDSVLARRQHQREAIATAAASSPERSRIAKVLDALKVPASGYYDPPDPYRTVPRASSLPTPCASRATMPGIRREHS